MCNSPSNDPSPTNLPFIGSSFKNCGNETIVCDSISWAFTGQLLLIMDEGAWKAAVHGVAERRTWLSDFTFTFPFHALQKEMATHSSVLAWRIPGTGEPDGLPSMGLHRVRHNWSDLAAAAEGTLRSYKLICLKNISNIKVTVHL